MPEQIPRQLGPDELFLSGRVQVDTAIEALAMTGVSPQAEEVLKAARDLYGLVTTPEAKDDLNVFLRGEQAAAMKADIVASVLLAEQSQRLSPELRIAARGLLDVLGIKK